MVTSIAQKLHSQ